MRDYKSKIYGVVASLLTLLILLLILLFVYIDKPFIAEDDGIMISFGDGNEGGGIQTEEPIASLPTQTVTPPPMPSEPSPNEYITQEDEQSLALEKQRKQEEAKKKAEEAERIRKQKEEQERIEAERIAKEKALAEEQAKKQAAIDKANQLGGLFSNGGSSNQGANGSDNSNATKGNPAGQGNSGGNSWSLKGRSLQGKLATPAYNSNVEGVVVVEIRVNAEGKVIDAKSTSGTTISDKSVQRAAEEAAKKAVFSKGENDVLGTITYRFKLN